MRPRFAAPFLYLLFMAAFAAFTSLGIWIVDEASKTTDYEYANNESNDGYLEYFQQVGGVGMVIVSIIGALIATGYLIKVLIDDSWD